MYANRPLPLSGHSLVESSSLDEIEAIYASRCYPVRLERAHDDPNFYWRAHYAPAGDVIISSHETAGWRASSETAGDVVAVAIPIAEAMGELSLGKQHTQLVRGKWGAVVQPGMPGRMYHAPGFQLINMDIPQHALDRALATLTGSTPREKVRFDLALPIDAPSSRSLMRLLRFFLEEADNGGIAPPALHRFGEALICQLLYTQSNNHSALLNARIQLDGPMRVRRVAEYLVMNLARDVRISELTALTGTSARSIQATFKKHYGSSPMDFLRERRLERARELLRRPDTRSIQEIAQACGLHHAGRFSTYYRARFGETPTQTRGKRTP